MPCSTGDHSSLSRSWEREDPRNSLVGSILGNLIAGWVCQQMCQSYRRSKPVYIYITCVCWCNIRPKRYEVYYEIVMPMIYNYYYIVRISSASRLYLAAVLFVSYVIFYGYVRLTYMRWGVLLVQERAGSWPWNNFGLWSRRRSSILNCSWFMEEGT